MATFKKNLSNDSRYSITLTVNETSTSIANNTSTCSYSLTATKSSGSGYYTSSTTNPIKITINGEVLVNRKIAYDFTGSTPKTITLASGTTTITHEADGTKTIQCSGYFKDAENSLGSATANGSLALTTLHKAPLIEDINVTELNTTLNYYNIPNDTFVNNVSKKTFTITSTLYDSASVSSVTLSSGNVSNTITTTQNPTSINLDIANNSYTLNENKDKAFINIEVNDSLNGKTSSIYKSNNYIPYTKPTLIASNLTSKRVGQLTGDVKLIASGTYYNGSIGTLTIQPIVYYRYRQITTPESSWGNWILATTPTTNNGTWSLEQTISSVFNYQNSYEIEVYCTDNFIQTNNADANNTTLTIPTYITKVLTGQPTFTEYKDRVDFNKITVKGTEIKPLTVETGNLSITKTSGNSTCTGTYSKYGNVMSINIAITTTGTTASAGNIFVGTINNATPTINTTIVGYTGEKIIAASIGSNGGITVRNTTSGTIANNTSVSIRGTFIVS